MLTLARWPIAASDRAGDLLVNAMSFAPSSYPAGWLRSLDRIEALDALRGRKEIDARRIATGV